MKSSEQQRQQINRDAEDLEKLGYVQELLRDMGGFSSFAVSFSVVSILTGATQLYGYGLNHGGPIQMFGGWFLVSFFTLAVALAMAELASAYPTAGALYHWSSYLGGRGLGWFTACLNTIGQFAVLAGIDYGLAQFIIGLVGWNSSPALSMGLYACLLFSHSILNHMGIRMVAWLNDFSAWYHIGVVVILLVALASHGFVQSPSFLLTFHHTDGLPPLYSFFVGILLAQWTLAGYDASAHVTEETVNPRKNAPWGIFVAVVVSVIAGFLMIAAVTLSIPDLAAASAYGDNAFFEILKLRLGPQFGNVVSALIAGAMWLCGLAAMTSASRMVYAFARDGGLPYSKIWAAINTKHRTPVNAIWGLSALAMGLTISIKLYSAVISVATIALYLSYGLPVFARLKVRFSRSGQEREDEIGPWNLGRASTLVAVVAVAWVAFISVIFVLPPNEQAGLVLGGGGLFLFGLWHFYVRHRFSGPRFHEGHFRTKEKKRA